MIDRVTVACVQMTSGPDIGENLRTAEKHIRAAAGSGAQFVSTPENTCHIRHPSSEKLKSSPWQKDHPGLPFFSALAKELKIFLHIGSMAVKAADNKLFNRSFLFGRDGALIATYDKIHLFDVQLPTGEVHRESAIMQAGEQAVIAETSFAKIGMSICYDLRFAHLYRDMAKRGASIMMIPSAFTVPTGKAHWAILNRARAIETGSFVISAAQVGTHEGGRKTYGHSMITGPWGEVLAQGDGETTGYIIADLELAKVKQARESIPALTHDRGYVF
jgi:deaminated glutathione amidase